MAGIKYSQTIIAHQNICPEQESNLGPQVNETGDATACRHWLTAGSNLVVFEYLLPAVARESFSLRESQLTNLSLDN